MQTRGRQVLPLPAILCSPCRKRLRGVLDSIKEKTALNMARQLTLDDMETVLQHCAPMDRELVETVRNSMLVEGEPDPPKDGEMAAPEPPVPSPAAPTHTPLPETPCLFAPVPFPPGMPFYLVPGPGMCYVVPMGMPFPQFASPPTSELPATTSSADFAEEGPVRRSQIKQFLIERCGKEPTVYTSSEPSIDKKPCVSCGKPSRGKSMLNYAPVCYKCVSTFNTLYHYHNPTGRILTDDSEFSVCLTSKVVESVVLACINNRRVLHDGDRCVWRCCNTYPRVLFTILCALEKRESGNYE